MFDIAFSELALIGVVALVVIGPERLPRVARAAGHLLGRAQRYVATVKSDINREMQLEDLKKMQAQLDESARQMMSSASQEFQSIQSSLEQTAKEAELQAQRAASDDDPAHPALAPDTAVTPASTAPADPTSDYDPDPEAPSPQLDLFAAPTTFDAAVEAQASLPLNTPTPVSAPRESLSKI